MTTDEFTVTDEHIKLLRRLHFSLSDSEVGVEIPAVDPHYPLGNFDVVDDVVSILEWELGEGWREEGVITRQQVERALQLVAELRTVLAIMCQNPGVCPLGCWRNTERYDEQWVKVNA